MASNTFRISSNRVFIVDGVRHEVDVHVEVEIADGYNSVFLFECKNWEDKVGKNEIIVFSEKIHCLQAQKGFFVAKSFTSDALAQAKKDARIQLLVVSERQPVPLPFDFFFVTPHVVSTDVTFAHRSGHDAGGRIALALESRVDGSTGLTVKEYAAAWAAEVVNADTSAFPAHELPDGEYSRETVATRTFGEALLKVGDELCSSATIRVVSRICVARPGVVTHYEVESRGRVISFAPVRAGSAEVQVRFVDLGARGR